MSLVGEIVLAVKRPKSSLEQSTQNKVPFEVAIKAHTRALSVRADFAD